MGGRRVSGCMTRWRRRWRPGMARVRRLAGMRAGDRRVEMIPRPIPTLLRGRMPMPILLLAPVPTALGPLPDVSPALMPMLEMRPVRLLVPPARMV